MTDLTALAQKLASLHSSEDVFENGARVIAQGGVPSGMSAFIRAIDDTVLERQLEIMTGTHIVTVVAAGRRLRGIANVVPPKGKSARLVGEPLSRDDKKSLAATGELLSSLLGAAPRLTLRSLPAESFGRSGDRGVSAATLAEVWDVDLDEAPLPPMERFLKGNAEAVHGFIQMRGGEVAATDGETAALQSIQDDQLDDLLAARGKLSGDSEGPQLMSLEGALSNGKAIALAQAEDETVLILYDPAALGQIHASWQAVFS